MTLAALPLLPAARAAAPDTTPRGLCALTLGPAAPVPPEPGAIASRGWEDALRIPADRWCRVGGDPALPPVSPTEARVAHNAAALYVRVRCEQPGRIPPETHGERPGSILDYPDRIAVFLRPRWDDDDAVKVTVSALGDVVTERWPKDPMRFPDDLSRPAADARGGAASDPDGWTTWVTIPWAAIGGRPAGAFGLNLLRVRGGMGETSSPAALDFHGEESQSQCLEVAFGDAPALHERPETLATLPSGRRFWQRPARLSWPTRAERDAIWQLQETLATTPTTPGSLPDRVALAQRWHELLCLEGFSFHPDGGGCRWMPGPGEFHPHQARREVNRALARGDEARAANVVDTLLRQFDAATRWWFADESPGNVRDDQWTVLDRVDAVRCDADALCLEGRAGGHPVTLTVTCPAAGGVRVHAGREGFFRPAAFLPVNSDGRFEVRPGEDWSLSIRGDDHDAERWHLARGDVRFRFGPAGETLAVELRGALRPDEVVWGMGERFNALDQRGNIVTFWQEDAYEGLNHGLRNQAYKVIPLLHFTRPASLFLNTTYRIRADLGNADPGRFRLTTHGPVLDFTVFPTGPREALAAYADLTGKPLLPPRWAFGPWAGGGVDRWRRGVPERRDPAAEILAVMARHATLDQPHTAIYAEGAFEHAPDLHARLALRGLRVLGWTAPTASPESLARLFPAWTEPDWPVVRLADGQIARAPEGQPCDWQFPQLDFTHPNAVPYLRARWAETWANGLAGTMVDFGDLTPEDARFHDGQPGAAMHDAFAREYHRAYREAWAGQRGDDHILFARGASPGSQASACHFGGDHPTNFAGLRSSLLGGLNFSGSGFSTWGGDIGGYSGWPTGEAFIRWIEFGTFNGLMRFHGTAPREPWFYADPAGAVYRRYGWLRENLGDYLYAAAVEAHRTGNQPLMQAMPLAFPGEPALARVDDQFLSGPDLLVAPVLEAGATARSVILPPGRWTDFWTGETFPGDGQTPRESPAPLETIPVFLRPGALMPVHLSASSLRWGDSMTEHRTAALIVSPPTARTERTLWESANDADPATAASEPMPGGFTVELAGRAETRWLLVYGATVSAVSVNGTALGRFDDYAGPAASTPGWCEREGRVLVRLPEGIRRRVEVRLTP